MEENKQINQTELKEPKHLLVLRLLGLGALVAGITLAVLGFFVFKMEFGFDGKKIANPALFVPGIFLIVFSLPMLFMGFSAKIAKMRLASERYMQEQNKQQLTQMADTKADIVSPAVEKTAKAVKNGLEDKTTCLHCGEAIEKGSKFCNHCGKEQTK